VVFGALAMLSPLVDAKKECQDKVLKLERAIA
jgi:hypothetical protein